MKFTLYFYIWLSFRPLICGYNSLKSFDGGWNELFGGQGLCIILVNLRKVNQ